MTQRYSQQHRSTAIFALLFCIALFATACTSDEVESARLEAERLSAKVNEVSTALESAQEQASAAVQQFQEKSAQLQECLADKTQQQNKTTQLIESLGDDLAVAHKDLEACEERAAQMDEYEAIVDDAARRICCAQRVERPEIDSFSIESERIICKDGGENELDC